MTRAEAAEAVARALAWWARRHPRQRGRSSSRVPAVEVAAALRAGLCRATARAATAAFGVTCNHGARDVLDCRPCLEALCVRAGDFAASVRAVASP